MLTGDVTGLRGVDLGVRDVAAQARFYTDVWRLAVVAERNAVDRLHAHVAAAGAPQVGAPSRIDEPGGGYGFAFMDPEGPHPLQ